MFSKILFFIFFVLAFTFVGDSEVSAQKQKLKLSLKDRRQIIKIILQDRDFSEAASNSSDGTVYLSSRNIPAQIQIDFPQIEGVKFWLITPEEIRKLKLPLQIFYFDEFKLNPNTVTVFFGHSRAGWGAALEYIFRKHKGNWKFKTGKIRLSMS